MPEIFIPASCRKIGICRKLSLRQFADLPKIFIPRQIGGFPEIFIPAILIPRRHADLPICRKVLFSENCQKFHFRQRADLPIFRKFQYRKFADLPICRKFSFRQKIYLINYYSRKKEPTRFLKRGVKSQLSNSSSAEQCGKPPDPTMKNIRELLQPPPKLAPLTVATSSSSTNLISSTNSKYSSPPVSFSNGKKQQRKGITPPLPRLLRLYTYN